MNEKKLEFFDELTSLLKGKMKPKSEDIIKREVFYDDLKVGIVNLFEESLKLNIFPNGFNLSSFLSENVDFPIERMKEQMEKTWLRDKLTIGLMGHFATGKTTALNLLFGETFQTDKHENTALATYLTFGKNTNVMTLVDKSGQSQELSLKQCEILDYSKGGVMDFPFARIFDYMVKENNTPLLKELTIIDTPGLFSSQTGHSAPTMKVVSSCDAIFWFIKITSSLTKADIDVIKESLSGLPLYIVFSFVDAIGTTPNTVNSSINKILDDLKKNGIECKGHFMLGKRESIREQFKNDTLAVLRKLSKEHEIYYPKAHVMGTIGFLEDHLMKMKKSLTKEIGKLKSKSDRLLASCKSANENFITECNNCASRFSNMIDTFNNRCSSAVFCGGASGALCSNLTCIQKSFNEMLEAYNDMDFSKLVEYGNKITEIEEGQSKLAQISAIFKDLAELQNKLS